MDRGASFGDNFYVFQRKYMIDANVSWSHLRNYFPKWVANPEKADEINSIIYSKCIRVMKSDYMDLPPYVHEVYEVDMSPSQKMYYKQLLNDYITFVEEATASGMVVANTAMTRAIRLQQVVTGFVRTDEQEDIEIKENPRLDALEELLTALHVKHKIIVWCSFRYNYLQIERVLHRLKIKYVKITGDSSAQEKDDANMAFENDESVRVVIANRKAAGIGINLVAADYSIVYSRNYSLVEELQSSDRNYRGGSQKHDRIVRIDLCATGTIDEELTKALKDKRDISDSILNIAKRIKDEHKY
jgi:SNF2 family DNA or RNA helicase